MFYLNGDLFEGEWEDDLKLEGSLTYANGDKYTGSFTNDKKHGQGKYVWANGMFYEGPFEEDQIGKSGKFVLGKTSKFEEFNSFEVMREELIFV